MIEYKRYILDNGLTVILHKDTSTPLVTTNMLYKVGSKHEDEKRTGFAHLFEHLMFSGSKHVFDYDHYIQLAGGDNNAFTNSDLTNFYNIMPLENLGTALWLEADRMLKLNINQKSLDIQKKVVVEEFKETSINKPYGDMWHHISDLAYKEHSYRWPTIGLHPDHIAEASLSDVEQFYQRYYNPDNAVLVIVGNIEYNKVYDQVVHWFGDISSVGVKHRSLQTEHPQKEYRERVITSEVPSEAFYMAFHMVDRLHKDYPVYDLISDILSGGRSARFYDHLLKETGLFSNIQAYISGTIDPGLFMVEAKLIKGADMNTARSLVWDELNKMKEELVTKDELDKVKNSLISYLAFSEVSITHKAINIAYYEMLGDVSMINRQEEEILRVQADDIQRVANLLFRKENCSALDYLQA